MILDIIINDVPIMEIGLVALKGTLDALMKPTQYKNMVTNENAAIDGVMLISTPSMRKVQKRDVVIPFYINAKDLIELQTNISKLEDFLVSGVGNTGVNTFFVRELETTYHLVFQSISAFSNFDNNGKALISIKFVEPNPKNRK